jgi:fumarate reductase subunit C
MMRKNKTEHKAYVRPVPVTWWLHNRRYFLFMIRESTSVFIGLFVALYLYQLFLISKGAEVHNLFQESLRSVPFVVFYAIVLLFALYHSITWLGLVSKIQIVRVGRLTVPPFLVGMGAYLSWIVASAVIAYLFLTLK